MKTSMRADGAPISGVESWEQQAIFMRVKAACCRALRAGI